MDNHLESVKLTKGGFHISWEAPSVNFNKYINEVTWCITNTLAVIGLTKLLTHIWIDFRLFSSVSISSFFLFVLFLQNIWIYFSFFFSLIPHFFANIVVFYYFTFSFFLRRILIHFTLSLFSTIICFFSTIFLFSVFLEGSFPFRYPFLPPTFILYPFLSFSVFVLPLFCPLRANGCHVTLNQFSPHGRVDNGAHAILCL